MKKTLLLFIFLSSFINAQLVNRSLIVPEFNNGLIKTYMPTSASAIATNATYTINMATLPNGLATTGSPNCVAMFNNDLFVTLTSASQRVYKFPNYGTNPAGSISNVSQITNAGNDYVGIAFDANGNLYTSEGSYLNTTIVKYTVASNYATAINLGNGGITSYFANITFDDSGNLWATDYLNNRVVAVKTVDLNTVNAPIHSLITNNTSWSIGGHCENTTGTLQIKAITKAFSQPEGIAFDTNGRLWVANNNDSAANEAATLVRISISMQTTILSTSNTIADPNMTNSINGYQVWNVPSSASGRAQLGGMQIDKALNRIYVNEQVSGSGMWFDIASLSSVSDVFSNYQLAITSTNPGNGGIYLATSTQVLENQNFENKLTVSPYPNPSNGSFTINTLEKIKTIAAFNILGKEIKINTLSHNQFSIENKGVYILKIEYENGQLANNKIVIN